VRSRQAHAEQIVLGVLEQRQTVHVLVAEGVDVPLKAQLGEEGGHVVDVPSPGVGVGHFAAGAAARASKFKRRLGATK
jgi:hypothetical protein